MAINIIRYIDISSGVAGANVVAQRELIARLFTDNEFLPPLAIVEFTTAKEVRDYFGSTSDEYLRALQYFSFVSKQIRSPQKISFARWVNVAVAPKIFGYVNPASPQALSSYTSITNGSFGLTIGGVVNTFSAIDFSGAGSLAAVAAILQTEIRTATGSQWTAATVTYNASRGSFDFVGGVTGGSPLTAISVQAGVGGTDISTLIGWRPAAVVVSGVLTPGAIISEGSAVETITDVLTDSTNASNNFGSFEFIQDLTLDEHIEAANWNKAQKVLFSYEVAVSAANAATWANVSTGLGEIGGTSLTLLANAETAYPEMLPMSITASTDYNTDDSTQNYMFQQQAGLVPSVTDDETADAMDALRINYYGQTQEAGQLLSFYQRGVMMGLATDPLDMGVYANEQWLKDAMLVILMTLFLSLTKVPANIQGEGQVRAALQSVIDQALRNGTISVGKRLTTAQVLVINQITSDAKAYHQVQNNGYWLNVVIVPSGDPVEYTATYTLVYSKDDKIRKVEGTHDLI